MSEPNHWPADSDGTESSDLDALRRLTAFMPGGTVERFNVASILAQVGERIAFRMPGESPRLMVIRDAVPTDEGGVTLTLETPSEHVGAAPYSGHLPPDDQDAADARCPAGPGGRVPAQAVRPADETGDHDAQR